MQYIFWLGSHPEISTKELTTTFNREKTDYKVVITDPDYLIIELQKELPDNFIAQLGGIERIAKVIDTKDKTITEPDLIELLSPTNATKITIGISCHGCRAFSTKKAALSLKRQLKENGIKMNFVLPQTGSNRLNSAQIIFNKLTDSPNTEVNIIKIDNKYLLGRTVQVQDIQAYELRDTQRPSRDTKVGMLPPKLAQVMLNLVPTFHSTEPKIYDPFCGMGTLLQEGWLKGYNMVGSDVAEAMIDATRNNLDWLNNHFKVNIKTTPQVFLHDITETLPDELENTFDAIVTEPYLGDPLHNPLSNHEVKRRQLELRPLYLEFFSNVRFSLVKNGWLVVVLPAFARKATKGNKYVQFPNSLVDEIESLGYICNYFAEGKRGLIYHRPDAYVAREITLWSKK